MLIGTFPADSVLGGGAEQVEAGLESVISFSALGMPLPLTSSSALVVLMMLKEI